MAGGVTASGAGVVTGLGAGGVIGVGVTLTGDTGGVGAWRFSAVLGGVLSTAFKGDSVGLFSGVLTGVVTTGNGATLSDLNDSAV